MSEKFNFVLPGKPEYIPIVRFSMNTAASEAGFDLEEIDDISTAVGEACQLIFCHMMEGYSKEYSVECETEPGRITVRVTNDVKELTEKTDRRCLDCPNEGELGMILIKTLMDEADILCEEDGQKTITMVKTKK